MCIFFVKMFFSLKKRASHSPPNTSPSPTKQETHPHQITKRISTKQETKINQLLNANARNAILDGTKIYLEFVVVVWVLEHINRQGRYELSEIFAKDKTTS